MLHELATGKVDKARELADALLPMCRQLGDLEGESLMNELIGRAVQERGARVLWMEQLGPWDQSGAQPNWLTGVPMMLDIPWYDRAYHSVSTSDGTQVTFNPRSPKWYPLPSNLR